MGKYVENNLGKNENIVKKAELNALFLVGNSCFYIRTRDYCLYSNVY